MHRELNCTREQDGVVLLGRFGIAARRVVAPFPIWLVEAREEPSGELLAVLADEELARAARFRQAAHRQRYLLAHAARRLLGESYLGFGAAGQRYGTNAWGKPHLEGQPRAACSISYSGMLSAIAWSRDEEIGIDLEIMRSLPDAADLARTHCTRDERRAIRALDDRPEELSHAFLATWVRKEACLKALGRGLSTPPSSIECGTGLARIAIDVGRARLESQVLVIDEALLVSWARCIRLKAARPPDYSAGVWQGSSGNRPSRMT